MSPKKATLSLILYSLISPLAAHAQFFGSVANPTKFASSNGEGLFLLLGNILKLVGTIAGIYMIFQFIMAGYTYISASGDSKKVEEAWGRIWQSLMGMVIIAAAFVFASVVERFTGIKILSPTIYGPGP